jgi:phage antirepressor YoqD-like protein
MDNNLGYSFASGLFSTLIPLLIFYAIITIGKQKFINFLRNKNKSQKIRKEIEETNTYLSVTEIAKHFKIKPNELNIIFSELKWIYKNNKWWIATDLGIMLGAKQYYNKKNQIKYVKWEDSIIEDDELISKIKEFRVSNNF